METDEALVLRFQQSGDESAFLELLNRYVLRLHRMLHTMFPYSVEDREDMEQEIFAALFRDLKRFRFRSSFGTYFYRFVRNKAIDAIRRSRRERNRLTVLKNSHEIAARSIGANPTEAALLLEESRRELADALFRLPAGERIVLFLKESEHLSIREISEILALREGTVKSRLHRARERVAEILDPRGRQHRVVEVSNAT